jgi:ribosome-associated translation inhibitor RaiA
MPQSPATDDQLGSLTDRIHVIRGERVMLDVDLARLYRVTTARLNQQVKRNPARFPPSFMFQLTSAEVANVNLLQNVTGSLKHRDPKLRPYAFTEHGCLMLSNVLRTQQAIEVSILVVQAFVRLRAAIAVNQDLARRVDELSRAIDQQLGRHSRKLAEHQTAILQMLKDIRRLTRFPEPVRREIGFTAGWRK